jgi:formylglycine-generating enzyme required for sulfatase activity
MRLLSIILTGAILLTTTQILFAAPSSHPAKEYEVWPFSASEAERRQEETAKALGVPVKKTITLGKNAQGKPVTMDLMLIPAGTFVMGTGQMPSARDLWIGIAAGAPGAILLLVLLGVLVVRAVRSRRPPQFSLRWLVLVAVAVSLLAMGGTRLLRYGEAVAAWERANGDDKPAHRVTITRPFYVGRTEVTQAQWQAVMGGTPSLFTGAALPVEQVSWNDCQAFVKKVSAAAGQTCRLPSEAEWEYACRAGSGSAYSFGDDEAQLGAHAWFDANSASTTHPVGGKKPNRWGLHDMHGNVWEWCQDWHGDYGSVSQEDPDGAEKGGLRVLRGGGWDFNPVHCRSAYRIRLDGRSGLIGFRVVLPAAPGP